MGRLFRYLLRIPLLLLHLLVSLPLVLLLINPLSARVELRGERLDHRAIRWWSGVLMRIFGFRVRRYGTPLPGAVMFVANHVSWIDIELMHSQRMMGFVAKAEISRWPLVGWLASRGGTIYHHRGSNDSLHGVMHQMVQRLQSGQAVGVFPEGRTTRGDAIGVFHARIFQPAVLAGVPAQPVALKYGPRGEAQTIVAFAEGESFFGNFIRLLGEPSRVVEVHFLEPVAPSDDGRRRMAEACRARIVAAMEGPQAPAP
ncbi:MAG TPA: lysophospholipid acyltransferase family protein [Arenimonas sp.]|nr:lysophospholipid acyltransferase family protein [Arenimonas sp.]